jgi:hypothetical protein
LISNFRQGSSGDMQENPMSDVVRASSNDIDRGDDDDGSSADGHD